MFRRFSPGDKPRFAAQQVNAWTDAAQAFASGNGRTLQEQYRSVGNATRFPVKNGTADDVPAFSVFELEAPAILPTESSESYQAAIAFSGKEVATDDTNKFAISQIFLSPDAEDSNAVLSGVTFARLIGNTGQTNATPTNGGHLLTTGETGPCVILYDPGPAEGETERIGIVRIGGGGGACGTCDEVHEFYTNGGTSGTFDVDYTIGGSTETLTFNWNTTAAQFETELLTHTQLSSGQVSCDGGPFPYIAIYATFTTVVDFPTINNASLVGGKAFMRKFSSAG